jgi:hypothetical protein
MNTSLLILYFKSHTSKNFHLCDCITKLFPIHFPKHISDASPSHTPLRTPPYVILQLWSRSVLHTSVPWVELSVAEGATHRWQPAAGARAD